MIDKDLIKNKMADIQGYFEELQVILKEETENIVSDKLKLRSLERLFQLIVDTSLDINTHIISGSDIKVPDDYQSTFNILAENDVLPMDFALKIAPSVGLRNLVVHKYGRVDLDKMVEDIKKGVDQYLEYLKYLDNFLSKNS